MDNRDPRRGVMQVAPERMRPRHVPP